MFCVCFLVSALVMEYTVIFNCMIFQKKKKRRVENRLIWIVQITTTTKTTSTNHHMRWTGRKNGFLSLFWNMLVFSALADDFSSIWRDTIERMMNNRFYTASNTHTDHVTFSNSINKSSDLNESQFFCLLFVCGCIFWLFHYTKLICYFTKWMLVIAIYRMRIEWNA